MFSINDKINVLIYSLQQIGWLCCVSTPNKQHEILHEMLERLHLQLVGDEQIIDEKWIRSEGSPDKFEVRITSRFKLFDVDSDDVFTSDAPVHGYWCAGIVKSEEDTMLHARLKANRKAETQFIENLLRTNKA